MTKVRVAIDPAIPEPLQQGRIDPRPVDGHLKPRSVLNSGR